MSAGDSGRRRLERLRQREASVRRQIAAVESGIAGEEKIASLLTQLGAGWWVLHDRRKSAKSPANIDHIVIGPTGIHVIDAKNWSGRLWVGDKGIIAGRTPRADKAKTVLELRDLIAREVAVLGFNVPVYGVIALAKDESVDATLVHGGLAYVPPSKLVTGIAGLEPVATPEQAYRLWELIDELHPPHTSPATPVRARPPLPPATRRARRLSAPPARGARPRVGLAIARLALLAGAASAIVFVAPRALHQAADSMSNAFPIPASSTSEPAKDASSSKPKTVCQRMTSARASRLLAVKVHRRTVPGGVCEFRRAKRSRPVAVIGAGRTMTYSQWVNVLQAIYGTSTCGQWKPLLDSTVVGVCVDPTGSSVSNLHAVSFDGAVIADA